MKLEAGITEGRDLPLGREDYLGVFECVFDIVLFQLRANITWRQQDFHSRPPNLTSFFFTHWAQ